MAVSLVCLLLVFFFFNDTATTEIYTLSLHDALPIYTKKIWAIGGGKGGIGKTLFTANLGVGLARMGKEVIVIDSDLGGANLHTLLGIKYVKYNLNDYLNSIDRKSTRLNSSHIPLSRMPSSA